MRILTAISMLVLMTCCSRDNNQDTLSVRLREIEELKLFDNSYVVFSESESYGSNYPKWTPEMDYYQDDMLLDSGGKMYRALVDSKGKDPKTSPGQWRLIPWVHPYFFLRDTAKTEDLRKLITDKHPYVRTYAFGALARRDYEGLFKVILDNLSDTTRFRQITADFEFDVCPAELMISHMLDDLTSEERDRLRELIDSKYSHLIWAKRWLTDK